MTFTAFLFRKLGTLKICLDKCQEIPVSEGLLTSSMVNVPKHCWNLHHSIFIIFIDPCITNSVPKSLSYWHAKCWDCLLTHLLPMNGILIFIGTIQGYQFRCYYLRNKNHFASFFLHFWKLDLILNILTEKMTLIPYVFPKLRTLKTWSEKCIKSSVSETFWEPTW